MEGGLQSSFIPHDAAEPTAVPKDRSSRGLSDLLILIGIVLFVASLSLAGAVFLYDQFLKSSAQSKIDQLQRAKEAFEPSLIHELTRLDDRMREADKVLGGHLAPTAFFKVLEDTTLSTIAFQTLEMNAPDAQHMTFKMTGVAASVNSIALQADLFSKNGAITSPIFSDINRQQDGVHFTLNALINPASVSYLRLLNDSTQSQTQQTTGEIQVPSSPFGAPQQSETQTAQGAQSATSSSSRQNQ